MLRSVTKSPPLLLATVVVGLALVIGLSVWPSGQTDASGHSAIRSFSAPSVAPADEITVTISAANYGDFGQVVETLPAGFSYVEDSATVRAKVDGQDVTLTILGADQTFSYRVTASRVADSHTFQGTLKDDQGVSRSIGGASSVTVMAATVTPSDTEATRSFSASSVAPADEITVTISAANYGDFGQVVETLPAGFSYVEDSATVRAKVDGQDVTLTILGADQTFSYRVTASRVADSHTFQGTLKDDQGVSRSIGGASSVTVMAATVTPSDTEATRSFSASSVAPADEITVTISAANYGDFGQVVETLPAGFSYVEDSATVRAKVDGQDVTLTILGADQTFSYRVTASRVADSHTFQGTLKDDQGVSRSIGGASSVTVQLPPGLASRSFSASRVSPGGRLKVTITARGYGPFGQVVETLPRGFAYVDGSITPSDTRVAKDGQDVTVTLLGEDKRFTYTVTVSRVVGTHSFSGILTDSEQIQSGIGGAARIAVAVAAAPRPTSRPSSGTGSGSGSSGSGGQPSSPTSTPTPRPTSTPTPTLGPTLTPVPTPTTAPAPTATTPDGHANDGPSAYGDDGSDGHANDGPSACGDDGSDGHANDGPSACGDDSSDGHANSRARCYRGRRRRVASVGEHRDHHRGLGFGRGRWPILPQIEEAIGVGTPEIVKDRGLV